MLPVKLLSATSPSHYVLVCTRGKQPCAGMDSVVCGFIRSEPALGKQGDKGSIVVRVQVVAWLVVNEHPVVSICHCLPLVDPMMSLDGQRGGLTLMTESLVR